MCGLLPSSPIPPTAIVARRFELDNGRFFFRLLWFRAFPGLVPGRLEFCALEGPAFSPLRCPCTVFGLDDPLFFRTLPPTSIRADPLEETSAFSNSWVRDMALDSRSLRCSICSPCATFCISLVSSSNRIFSGEPNARLRCRDPIDLAKTKAQVRWTFRWKRNAWRCARCTR